MAEELTATTPTADTGDSLIQEFVTEADTHYLAATGKTMAGAGLDPVSVITAILAILAQMCPKPPAHLKAAAQARGRGTVFAVQTATRQALREQHPGIMLAYRKFDGDKIADAVLATIAAKDEHKLQAGLDLIAA